VTRNPSDDLLPSPLLPRMIPFRPFAQRIGVDPNVLRDDVECPPVLTIGGIEHCELELLARFELALFWRALAEESTTRQRKSERRKMADTAIECAVPHAHPVEAP
jgi:hypothetical protein